MISNQAYIHPDAKLGKNVTVEPFAYIAGDVVIEQSVRILTTLLGGDDALGGQRRGSGHQSLGVRMLRMLQHFQ